MAKPCKCTKNFQVSTIDYLGNKQHSPVYFKPIYTNGDYYYYFNDKYYYYVSTDKKYLRDMNYYHDDIEVMDQDVFDEHFITVIQPKNNYKL